MAVEAIAWLTIPIAVYPLLYVLFWTAVQLLGIQVQKVEYFKKDFAGKSDQRHGAPYNL